MDVDFDFEPADMARRKRKYGDIVGFQLADTLVDEGSVRLVGQHNLDRCVWGTHQAVQDNNINTKPRIPRNKPTQKPTLDAMQVLNKLSWVTTMPVDTACILMNDNKERPLTNAEWGAQMRMSTLCVGPFTKYWLLKHENSGLLYFTGKYISIVRVLAITMQATVRDILKAIENMTIKANDGPYKIADNVNFNGIRKVTDGIFSVNANN